MTDKSDFSSLYTKGMEPVADLLTESALERMRTSAIGGASISLGVVLLLLQTDLGSGALVTALYLAVFAIPTWIVAWQYVESYMTCGKDSYGHFNSPKGSLVAVSFALVGMLLLFASVVCLIWHMSVIAAILFAVFSALMAFLVFRHHAAVRLYVTQAKRSGA